MSRNNQNWSHPLDDPERRYSRPSYPAASRSRSNSVSRSANPPYYPNQRPASSGTTSSYHFTNQCGGYAGYSPPGSGVTFDSSNPYSSASNGSGSSRFPNHVSYDSVNRPRYDPRPLRERKPVFPTMEPEPKPNPDAGAKSEDQGRVESSHRGREKEKVSIIELEPKSQPKEKPKGRSDTSYLDTGLTSVLGQVMALDPTEQSRPRSSRRKEKNDIEGLRPPPFDAMTECGSFTDKEKYKKLKPSRKKAPQRYPSPYLPGNSGICRPFNDLDYEREFYDEPLPPRYPSLSAQNQGRGLGGNQRDRDRSSEDLPSSDQRQDHRNPSSPSQQPWEAGEVRDIKVAPDDPNGHTVQMTEKQHKKWRASSEKHDEDGEESLEKRQARRKAEMKAELDEKMATLERTRKRLERRKKAEAEEAKAREVKPKAQDFKKNRSTD